MRTATLWLAVSLLLAGCVSGLHSNQPAQQQYLLRPQLHEASGAATASPALVAAGAEATLQVLMPIAAAGLSSENMVVIRSGQRLDYYAGARWAATAPSMLQLLAIEALRRQRRFSLVEADPGPFDARYVLSLELTHFEAEYGGNGPPTVQVTVVCTLGRRATRSVLVSFTAHGEARADADRMQPVVAAFERATDDALAQMAAAIVPPADPADVSPATPSATPP